MFKRGQSVNIVISGGGVVTKEPGLVKSVTKKGVMLDNGEGNTPSGPFDATTGEDISSIAGVVPGWSRKIEPVSTK